jgi:hypothetical protein
LVLLFFPFLSFCCVMIGSAQGVQPSTMEVCALFCTYMVSLGGFALYYQGCTTKDGIRISGHIMRVLQPIVAYNSNCTVSCCVGCFGAHLEAAAAAAVICGAHLEML